MNINERKSLKRFLVLCGMIIGNAYGCAAENASPEDVEVEMSALNQDVGCGASYGFPTWSWWGWTTVHFGNRDSSGTKILDATYQAGAGSPKSAEVGSSTCAFEESNLQRRECEISQQWGGFTLNVHNRGWWEVNSDGSKGAYHPCGTSSDGPALTVNTQ